MAAMQLVWHEDDDGSGGRIVQLTGPGGTLLMNPRRFLEFQAHLDGRTLTDDEAKQALADWIHRDHGRPYRCKVCGGEWLGQVKLCASGKLECTGAETEWL